MAAFSVSGLLWISNAARACGSDCSGTCSRAGRGVVEHGVAVAEGAALDVLAGQADGDAVGEDRGEAPVPRRRPSRSSARPASSNIALAPLAAAFELAVHREARRARVSSVVVERAQPLERHGRVAPARAAPGGGGSGMRRDEVLFGLQRGVGAARSSPKCCCTIASASAGGDRRRARPACAPRARARSGARRCVWYISGCVNAGSSPSLWP